MWHVTTEVNMLTKEKVGYRVEHPTQNFPVDILFDNKRKALEMANWLNDKDVWIEKLELIVEHCRTDLEEEKEKHNEHMKWMRLKQERFLKGDENR